MPDGVIAQCSACSHRNVMFFILRSILSSRQEDTPLKVRAASFDWQYFRLPALCSSGGVCFLKRRHRKHSASVNNPFKGGILAVLTAVGYFLKKTLWLCDRTSRRCILRWRKRQYVWKWAEQRGARRGTGWCCITTVWYSINTKCYSSLSLTASFLQQEEQSVDSNRTHVWISSAEEHQFSFTHLCIPHLSSLHGCSVLPCKPFCSC